MVTTGSTLSEILASAGSEKILRDHGVPCMTCPLAAQEVNKLTIGQVAKIYQLDGDMIIKDLNESLTKRKKL